MYGSTGKVLRVNLTESKTKVHRFEENFYKKFLGGVGLGAKVLFDEVPLGVDPLGSENRLVFAAGPFQNTGILESGRWSVSSKSPLTGIWGEANCGGALGMELRSAGFDAMIIQGNAGEPVYLWVHDDEIEIKSASKLWGLDSYQTYDKITEGLEESKASIITIGQAGENLVRTANIVNDKKGFAGRTGMGAVMGSKNLKAIAVFGTSHNIEVANPEKLKELNTDLIKRQAEKVGGMGEHGMPYFLPLSYDYRSVPIKNWSQGDWTRGIVALSPPRYTEILSVKRSSCPGICPIACRRGEVTVEEPEKYAFKGVGPEYEALGLLGANLLIGDLKALAKLNDLCNRYGVDVISTGSAIGVMMECYEKGILTKEDIGGLKLKWGDADAAIKLLEKIVNREGIGDKLANGTLSAAKDIGEEAVRIVQHVKGLDFPAHDPRACNYMGLNYATSNRGASHLRGFILDFYQVHMHPQAESVPPITIPELDLGIPPKSGWRGQSKYVAVSQNWACLFDSLIQCKCAEMVGKDDWGIGFGNQLKLLNHVTGWNLSPEEFMKIGERIFNFKRAFNVREGISRKDDQLPPRSYEKVHPRHSITPLSLLLDEYYDYRGWTSDGKPSKEKLLELDLGYVANALWGD